MSGLDRGVVLRMLRPCSAETVSEWYIGKKTTHYLWIHGEAPMHARRSPPFSRMTPIDRPT